MKIYKITTYVGKRGFACLRPSSKQNLKQTDMLDVWWDDWCSGGNKIADFVDCYSINVCRLSIFLTLKEHFKELIGVTLRYNKTEKELKAKNIKRLKWLPQEEIPLIAFYSPKSFDCLPHSTIEFNSKGMIKFIGIAEMKGEEIIPREIDKGLFFSSQVLGDFDFFTLTNSNHLLCTERVKKFCEESNFENVCFLEVGDII